MDNKIRRWRRYERCDASVKEAILHEIARSDLSIKEISERYLVNTHCIYMWLYRMRKSQDKDVSLHSERHEMENQAISVVESMPKKEDALKGLTEEQLKKKVLELEKALEYEKLRTEALDMMIDIAENQEGISIRKKSGAKRL
jgi:transposase